MRSFPRNTVIQSGDIVTVNGTNDTYTGTVNHANDITVSVNMTSVSGATMPVNPFPKDVNFSSSPDGEKVNVGMTVVHPEGSPNGERSAYWFMHSETFTFGKNAMEAARNTAKGWMTSGHPARRVTLLFERVTADDRCIAYATEVYEHPESTYTVIVGNVGTVITTESEKDARKDFDSYVEMSKSGRGRFGNESVVLMKDGEPIDEYTPEQQQ